MPIFEQPSCIIRRFITTKNHRNRTAFKEGWHVEQSRKNAEEAEKARKKKEVAEQKRMAAEEKAKAKQEAENNKVQRAAMMEKFNSWPQDEQARLINQFLEVNPVLRVIYQQRGTTSQLFIVPFATFLINSHLHPAFTQ